MTDRRFKLADHLLRHEALGSLRDGGDRRRPDPSRVLEVSRPAAPHATTRTARTRTRSASTTTTWTGDRRAPPARRRRHRRLRRLGPRREADGRRHPDQRVAAPRGPADDEGASRPSVVQARRRRRRLERHRRLGRGRLLLADLHERPRSRARGDRRRRRLRARARRPGPAARGDPGRERQPDRHEGVQARGGLPRGERRGAGSHRPLRRPALALDRDDRRRRRHPHVRERHRARTTRTTPSRAS